MRGGVTPNMKLESPIIWADLRMQKGDSWVIYPQVINTHYHFISAPPPLLPQSDLIGLIKGCKAKVLTPRLASKASLALAIFVFI